MFEKERECLESMRIAANQNIKERDYWLNKLSGEWIKSGFPFDYDRYNKDIDEHDTASKVEFGLNGEFFHRLMSLSNGSDTSLYMILVTVLYILLHKYTGHKDIIIGTPVYKQDTELELINTILPLRNEIKESMTIKQLILEIRQSIIEGIENYSYPIEFLPDQLKLPNSRNGFPLFDMGILLKNIHDKRYLRHIPLNIVFSFLRNSESIDGTVEYNGRYYGEQTIKRIINNLKNLVSITVSNVNLEIGYLDMLAEEEKNEILYRFNDTAAAYPQDKTFSMLFEAQVELTPNRVAVVFDNNLLTYIQLNEKANRMARLIRAKGVGADSIVAIMEERSQEMVTGILGTIKAGGAYLPLDPDCPEERIAYMLEDSSAHLLLTQNHLRSKGNFKGEIIDIKDPRIYTDTVSHNNLISINKPTDLVYVIYTSGTTGNPKGVMIQNNSFINAAYAWRSEYHLSKMEINLLQIAGFSFDVFAGDIARTLINGGKLVICPEEVRLDFSALYSLIREYLITLFESIPSLVIPFIEYIYENELEIGNLQLLIVGSDSFRAGEFKKIVSRFGKNMRIINSYGVTEATIDTSYFDGNVDNIKSEANVPIGKPLPNMRCYILDTNEHLLPIGALGELYIGGKGVARGYLNNIELTRERFLPDPFFPRERIYKTGDLVRWLFDGNIEFLGRTDHQVKIRGYRIEPGEIEKYLLQHDRVKEAIVINSNDESGEKYLCAYVVLRKKFRVSLLRKYLLSKLPDYMIPSYFMPIDKIPLTLNGKIDRKTLPEPGAASRKMIYIPGKILDEQKTEMPSTKKDIEVDAFLQHEDAEEQKLLKDDEKKRILFDFNEINSGYPADKTIHQLFEEQVKKSPENMALVFEGQHLTYRLLNKKVYQLARVLRDSGVTASSIVGIMVERSMNMMIGILGILKAGGAFMPMDPEAPEERLLFMLEDAQAKLLLTTNNIGIAKYPYKTIDLDNERNYYGDGSNLSHLNCLTDLSHILYTSGTTGTPKGVMLEYKSVVNLMEAVSDLISFREDDNVISLTPITFDVFTAETILPLTKGSKVVIGTQEAVLDYKITAIAVEKEYITIYQSTPSVLQRLISDPEAVGQMKSLRCLITAGEPLLDALLEQLKRNIGATIFNLYGPTETTLYSTGSDVTVNALSIGKPLLNTRIYILGRNENLMPIGASGELCIGGVGVARGYLNRPELTFDKFVPNPFIEVDRIYKTGDLVRWMQDGNIEFIGRIDHQVKLGGIRIEPGEIENCLLDFGVIKEVAVVVRKNKDKEEYLCAFIVSNKTLEEPELRTWVSKKIPHYMIPALFVQLEKMPLTPNRKINRKLLTALEIEMDRDTYYIAPRNEIEAKMVEIWSAVLGITKETISIYNNFFELGGHSLKATALVSRIRETFNATVPLIEIFKKPTIESLAKCIRIAGSGIPPVDDEHLVLLKTGADSALHLFLIHDGSGEVEGYIDFCQALPPRFNCWGLRAERLEHLTPRRWSIEALAQKYIERIREVQPHGPYWIVGWSLGGTVSFEITLQMEKMGIDVAFLGLIDSPGPRAGSDEKTGGFTLKSELAWVWQYLPGEEIKEKLRKAADINEIWPTIASHMQENNFSVEIIKRLIPDHLVRIIPNYHQLGTRELIYHMNINRTLTNARASYIPSKKIHTTLHYFKASQSPGIPRDCWNEYCLEPIKSYEIPGDHFSILKRPGIDQTVKIFKNVCKR